MEDSPRREPWDPHAENAKPRTGRKPIVFRHSVAEMPFKFDTRPVSTLDRPREIVTFGAPRTTQSPAQTILNVTGLKNASF